MGVDGKVKYLVSVKVTSKGDDKIVVQSSNHFSKTAEQLLNRPEVIPISQEGISSTISEVIDWGLTKTQPLALVKNNIHIVTYNDGHTVQAF